jgi:hypothetical protein
MLLIAGQRVTSAEDLQAEAPNGHRLGHEHGGRGRPRHNYREWDTCIIKPWNAMEPRGVPLLRKGLTFLTLATPPLGTIPL